MSQDFIANLQVEPLGKLLLVKVQPLSEYVRTKQGSTLILNAMSPDDPMQAAEVWVAKVIRKGPDVVQVDEGDTVLIHLNGTRAWASPLDTDEDKAAGWRHMVTEISWLLAKLN